MSNLNGGRRGLYRLGGGLGATRTRGAPLPSFLRKQESRGAVMWCRSERSEEPKAAAIVRRWGASRRSHVSPPHPWTPACAGVGLGKGHPRCAGRGVLVGGRLHTPRQSFPRIYSHATVIPAKAGIQGRGARRRPRRADAPQSHECGGLRFLAALGTTPHHRPCFPRPQIAVIPAKAGIQRLGALRRPRRADAPQSHECSGFRFLAALGTTPPHSPRLPRPRIAVARARLAAYRDTGAGIQGVRRRGSRFLLSQE